MLDLLKARIGLKLAAASAVVVAAAAAVLIVASTRIATDLGDKAAGASADALREQAIRTLQATTARQSLKYEARFREASRLSRTIAATTETILNNPSAYESPLQRTEMHTEKGYLTNGRNAPASVIAWGSERLTPAQRKRVKDLSHLDPLLTHAKESSAGIKAAWTMSQTRTSRYVPNTPLVDALPPTGRNNPHDHIYYKAATPALNPAQQTVWTRVYQDPAGQGLMTSVLTPFHRPGEGPETQRFAGVAGIDLTVEDMSAALARVRSRTDDGGPQLAGFSFLMDDDSRLIAFPDDKLRLLGFSKSGDREPADVMDYRLADSSNPAARELAATATGPGSPGHRRLTLDGRRYIAAVRRMPATGWLFANLVPEETLLQSVQAARRDIDADVRAMTWQLGWLTGGGLLAALSLLVIYFSWALVAPLHRLAAATRRVGQGDLDLRLGETRRDEIGEVARGFDQMTATIREQIATLEERVEARTRELREARDRAAAADAAKMRFLSSMKHELRSPLQGILGYADLIRSKRFGERTDLYAEHAQVIHESGEHLLSLVEDVLSMAKLEHGTYALQPDWVDAREVAQVCARMIQPQAESHGATLTTDLPAGQIALYADERALRQMVINLLSNAVKFAGDGGTVTLAAEVRETGELHIRVSDTGPGIAPADQARVLTPFEQLDNGSDQKGTGLGLAITKRFADLHDASLTIDSALGAGSTFTLVFPASRLQQGEDAA